MFFPSLNSSQVFPSPNPCPFFLSFKNNQIKQNNKKIKKYKPTKTGKPKYVGKRTIRGGGGECPNKVI